MGEHTAASLSRLLPAPPPPSFLPNEGEEMQQLQQVAGVSASWGMGPRGQSPSALASPALVLVSKGSQHQAPSVIQEARSKGLLISVSITEVLLLTQLNKVCCN